MKIPFAAVLTTLAITAVWCGRLAAEDQTGAEKAKVPVKAAVVGGVKWNDQAVGNIEVTYADGTRDRWTTKGNCGDPRVAADGTVGWTVYAAERPAATASYNIRPNGTVVMCRRGKVLCRVETLLGFAEEWGFADEGKRFVVKSRALHGPAKVELHETDTGKLVAEAEASAEKLPAWAEPYRE